MCKVTVVIPNYNGEKYLLELPDDELDKALRLCMKRPGQR